MKEYQFKVETKHVGQKERYGDSFYSYEVTSPMTEMEVKEFCTKLLRPAKSEEKYHEDVKTGDFGMNFAPYYTRFKKVGENVYEYEVVETFAD